MLLKLDQYRVVNFINGKHLGRGFDF